MIRTGISGLGPRLTALLLGYRCPICSFVAPFEPGAAVQTSLYES